MNWSDGEAALELGVASVFDTMALRVYPYREGKSVNQGTEPDPDRNAFDFSGSIEMGPPFLPAGRGAAADPSMRDRAVGHEAVLTAHSRAWPYRPRRGDKIVNLASDEAWKVADSDNDGSDRAAFSLNRWR